VSAPPAAAGHRTSEATAVDTKRAIITAAGESQRTLPLQTLVDRDGATKTGLRILVEEALAASIEEICVVIAPGDEPAYAAAAGPHRKRLRFVVQERPAGYGHAVHCARDFARDEPFLLMVGDHLYVSRVEKRCAQQLVELASAERCAVSAVQPTHESKLPYYGTVGGHRVANRKGLYEVAQVIEKPTPTEAEQKLLVSGLRSGHYLCFFGMHVLTPLVMELLGQALRETDGHRSVPLTPALAALASRERYLAHEVHGSRYDIGLTYGLLSAQLALALSGRDRDEVLSLLVELLATRTPC
jgi:UTP--glucose-1-phosphate uridylyltransferase